MLIYMEPFKGYVTRRRGSAVGSSLTECDNSEGSLSVCYVRLTKFYLLTYNFLPCWIISLAVNILLLNTSESTWDCVLCADCRACRMLSCWPVLSCSGYCHFQPVECGSATVNGVNYQRSCQSTVSDMTQRSCHVTHCTLVNYAWMPPLTLFCYITMWNAMN